MPASAETASPAFVVRDAFTLPADERPVRARASRHDSYAIHVTRSADAALDRLCALLSGAKVALVSDETVMELHGGQLLGGLQDRDVDVIASVLPAGERSKSLEQATRLWHWLAESSIARRDVLVSFGGGVINDTAGWVASGYMRGIPYVNVPTTLLAQVDGALGGKVAVNHPVAKNLIVRLYKRVGVTDRAALVALGLRRGWID
jgi:3-dehydroquinate synthase